MVRHRAGSRAHLVIFPWPATGHFDSVVQLLYSFDSKRPGIRVTVVCTGKMISQLVALQGNGDFRNIDLHLKELYDADPRYEKDPVFPYRSCLTSESLNEEAEWVKAELIALKDRPGAVTSVLSDLFLYWCKDLADELGVPWYTYSPCGSAASIILTDLHKVADAFVHHRFKIPKNEDPLHVAVPDLVYFRGMSSLYYGDIPNEAVEFPEFYIRMGARIKQAAGHVINTSQELDAPMDCISALKLVVDSPNIFCIGPSLQMPGFGHIYSSVNTSSSSLPWLDAHRENSVLYVSFGSLVEMSKSSIRDLASGLEASGVPFLWAIKIGSEQISEVLPPGFLERTSDRGLVETGWVPQRDILLHPATGGFFTHCGWNSTLESICAGIPCVGWPVWADQFMNVRFIEDVTKIGIAVSHFKEENKHNFKDIGSREIELAIKALMQGNEGCQARANIAQIQKEAKAAMVEGGSSYQQLNHFLDQIACNIGGD